MPGGVRWVGVEGVYRRLGWTHPGGGAGRREAAAGGLGGLGAWCYRCLGGAAGSGGAPLASASATPEAVGQSLSSGDTAQWRCEKEKEGERKEYDAINSTRKKWRKSRSDEMA